MARKRTVEVSALNISMHAPHSPQGYVDLLKRSLRRRRVFAQGEIHALMLGSLTGTADAVKTNELSGEIFRFVKIDQNAPWFNTVTNEAASDEELADLNIPQNLRAHMQQIPFIFFPKEHQFWYISHDGKMNLGPSRMEAFLQRMLSDTAAAMNVPQVEVTVLPERYALERMLQLPRLERILMQFKRPNPDDAEDIAAKIMQRMQAQGLSRVNEELIGTRGGTITPDAQTRAEAAVAAINGRVEVHGRDDQGVLIRESTEDKPLRVPLKIDPSVETQLTAIRQAKAGH